MLIGNKLSNFGNFKKESITSFIWYANELTTNTINFTMVANEETLSVDWGDNTQLQIVNVNSRKSLTKKYETSGTYTVKILNNISKFWIDNQSKTYIKKVISWGSKIENVYNCFNGCTNLCGPIPKWGKNITNAYSCYKDCNKLTGNIPAWNSTITNASDCYNGCTQLTGNIPKWGEQITHANNCYQNCSNLTGNIPKWGEQITHANNCYQNCSNLSGIWNPSAQKEEVCPERIISHNGCVTGCSEAVKDYFYTDWGGNKQK